VIRLLSSSLDEATDIVELKVDCERVFDGEFSGDAVGLKIQRPSGPSYR